MSGDTAASNDELVHVNVSDWLLTVENVDNAVYNQMKRIRAAVVDNLCLEHVGYSHPSIVGLCWFMSTALTLICSWSA
jgi:hypothetical protein